jgi:hypothetical protein
MNLFKLILFADAPLVFTHCNFTGPQENPTCSGDLR